MRLLVATVFFVGSAALAAPPTASVSAEYVSIPTGVLDTVLSGGGGGNAPVSVPAFFMRTMPVTVLEFMAFTKSHPEWGYDKVPAVFADKSYLRSYVGKSITTKLAAQPVTSVSWFAAAAYCENEGARLPTWYEWEYVAAADATHPDARKDPAWRAQILGWYARPASADMPAVGTSANYYGVRDMHGLIWEWVDDFNALLVSADSRNQGDPDQLQYCGAGAISLQDRENFAILMRVALLSSLNGADATNSLGFRCAKSSIKEKQ